ncbi:Alpha-1,4-N-acetylhexosaminyltransferase EXTL2 [Intoshia linei]|uniref:Alpha-1,4-N-acetylhexosaminyltransferase EXTL2 n=1 Tax=Intoshia linei TaxID=1819745 RepID=A0A177AXC9_9BILA|nr:Alpha-1,4-N-acetylhexosaminyltransferase EXTL2 [Intoshia linei]
MKNERYYKNAYKLIIKRIEILEKLEYKHLSRLQNVHYQLNSKLRQLHLFKNYFKGNVTILNQFKTKLKFSNPHVYFGNKLNCSFENYKMYIQNSNIMRLKNSSKEYTIFEKLKNFNFITIGKTFTNNFNENETIHVKKEEKINLPSSTVSHLTYFLNTTSNLLHDLERLKEFKHENIDNKQNYLILNLNSKLNADEYIQLKYLESFKNEQVIVASPVYLKNVDILIAVDKLDEYGTKTLDVDLTQSRPIQVSFGIQVSSRNFDVLKLIEYINKSKVNVRIYETTNCVDEFVLKHSDYVLFQYTNCCDKCWTDSIFKALQYTVIPIFCITTVSNFDKFLPFNQLIDWLEISFIVYRHDLINFLSNLSQINSIDKKIKLKNVFYKHFSSLRNIFLTINAIISKRLNLPLPVVHRHESFNKDIKQNYFIYYDQLFYYDIYSNPFIYSIGQYSHYEIRNDAIAKLYYKYYNFSEKLTVILLFYQQDNILENLLVSIKDCLVIEKIIIVYNNIDKIIDKKKFQKISPKIHIVESKKNSLNNRFIPFHLIHTDCILSLDYDISITHDNIYETYWLWVENRDRIIGLVSRDIYYDHNTRIWKYDSGLSCRYSMVLTGAAMFHLYYSFYYTYELDIRIKNHIDKFMNCEDIAFNFMVAHITRKSPIKNNVLFAIFSNQIDR